MPKEIDTDKTLELTTCIVLEAMRSGKLDASDGQIVADYFLTVCKTMSDCAALSASDIETLFRRLNAKRLEVNSDC